MERSASSGECWASASRWSSGRCCHGSSSVSAAESITSDVLAYQLLVVIVALIGGIWPALFAAVLSGRTLDFLFVDPCSPSTIADPLHALALVLYVSSRSSSATRRSGRAPHPDGAAPPPQLPNCGPQSPAASCGAKAPRPALVSRAREAFGMTARAYRTDRTVLATDGEPVPDGPTVRPSGGDRGCAVRECPTARWRARRLGAPPPRRDHRRAGGRLSSISSSPRRPAKPGFRRDRPGAHRAPSAVSHDLRRPLAAAVPRWADSRRRRELSPEDRADSSRPLTKASRRSRSRHGPPRREPRPGRVLAVRSRRSMRPPRLSAGGRTGAWAGKIDPALDPTCRPSSRSGAPSTRAGERPRLRRPLRRRPARPGEPTSHSVVRPRSESSTTASGVAADTR